MALNALISVLIVLTTVAVTAVAVAAAVAVRSACPPSLLLDGLSSNNSFLGGGENDPPISPLDGTVISVGCGGGRSASASAMLLLLFHVIRGLSAASDNNNLISNTASNTACLYSSFLTFVRTLLMMDVNSSCVMYFVNPLPKEIAAVRSPIETNMRNARSSVL